MRECCRARSLQFCIVYLFGVLLALLNTPGIQAGDPVMLVPEVISEFPHDMNSFTQGLLLRDGMLYESTGLYGRSCLRVWDPISGIVTKQVDLPTTHFGEGLALAGQKLCQITWKERIAHLYDAKTLEKTGEFHYEGDGWGLCFDGTNYIMTDGLDHLQFRDSETFKVLRTVPVTYGGRPVQGLNELEYVDGFVWANIYDNQHDIIVKVNPSTGDIVEVVDAAGLLPPERRTPETILNGIAYNPASKTFMITGKLWPAVFEVRFVPKPAATAASQK